MAEALTVVDKGDRTAENHKRFPYRASDWLDTSSTRAITRVL